MRSAAGLRGTIAAAAAALLVVATAGPGSAQEARVRPERAPEAAARQAAPPYVRVRGPAGFVGVPSDGPRLGVYLRAGCQVGSTAVGTCEVPPIVASVVEGAPAAAAGLQPGDTLLALDGADLRTQAARRAMGALEEGVPVRLRVARASGRTTVSVTPTARATTGVFRLSGTPWSEAPRSDLQVFRLQDDEGRVAEFYFTPPSGRPVDPNGFVVFGQGEDGMLKLEFGRPGVEIRTPDGRQLELVEFESHFRALEAGGSGETPIPPGVQAYRVEVDVESDGRTEEVKRRVVLENAHLAERLQSVHTRTLSDARVRIDSVRRLQVELARRGELPPAAAAGYSYVVPSGRVRAAPRPPRWGEAVLAPADHRLAGAEFRALTPELAEYFPVPEGLLVLRVIPETPAHRLGLRGGDVVVEVGGREMPDILTFRRLVAESRASPTGLLVKWNRKGREMSGTLASR